MVFVPSLLCLTAATASAAPTVRFLDVDSASPSSFVGIHGRGFGDSSGKVLFDTELATISLWSDHLVIVRVPSGARDAVVAVETVDGLVATSPVPLKIHKGRIFVVSTAGDDQGSGTEQEPFQSLQKAMSVVQAGDTVLVRAGTYDEQGAREQSTLLARGGTEQSPITWRGFAAERPIIRGDRPKTQDYPVILVESGAVRLARLAVDGRQNNTDSVVLKAPHASAVDIDVGAFHNRGLVASGEACFLAGNQVHGGGIRPTLDHAILVTGPDAVVRDNVITDIANGYGVYLQYTTQSNGSIFDNWIRNAAAGGIGLSSVGGGNWIFNNVVRAPGDVQGCRCAFRVGDGSQTGVASATDHIVFNTVVGPAYAGVVVADRAGTLELHSNIFSDVEAGIRVEESTSQPALQSSHNLWNGSGTDVTFLWDGTWQPFDEFADASNQEQDSLVADPLFTNASLGDFHLRDSSPAIDRGGGTSIPAADHDGVARPIGPAADIGAFEHLGTDAVDAGLFDAGASGTGGGAGRGGASEEPEGGTGAMAASGMGGSTSSGANGDDSRSPAAQDDGGCGCQVPLSGGRDPRWFWLLLATLLGRGLPTRILGPLVRSAGSRKS